MSLITRLIGVCIARLIVYSIALCYVFVFVPLMAFRFLCSPFTFFRVKHRPAPPSCSLDPRYGTHKKEKINGRVLHYVESGNPKAPLVVFVHGFPENWWSWRHQIPALATEYHVVALNTLGYGDSEEPGNTDAYLMKHLLADLHGLVKHLGHDTTAVVGHDWGGALCWELAYRHPEMVRRLIILDSPARPAYLKRCATSLEFFHSWFIFLHLIPGLAEFFWSANDMQVLDFMMTSRLFNADGKHVTKEDLDVYKYYFGKNGFRGPLTYIRSTFSFTSLLIIAEERDRGEVFHIKPKTLILWGGADPFLTRAMAQESAKLCDDARIQIFEGAGHCLQQHEPEGVTRALQQFLKD